jgi:hypothetical protein
LHDVQRVAIVIKLEIFVENGFTYCTEYIKYNLEKMSAPTIVNVRNFDLNRLTFVVGPKKAGRMPSVNMKYDGQAFNLRFPSKMGVRMWSRTDDKTGNTSYTLTTNMKGCDPYARERSTGTSDTDALYNLVVFDLKEKILSVAEEKSKEWFGKKRERAGLLDAFKEMYRASADRIDGEYVPNGKYPPSMTLKLPVYDNKVSTDVINDSGNPVYLTPDTLGKVFENNVEVNMVASPSLYIIAGGSFGITWRLNYAQVFQRSRINAASVFMTEEATEEATETAETAEEESVEQTPVEASPPPTQSAPARKKRTTAGQ